MPANNRKNPKRSKSSESQYSIMEFMRDFPDDEACLNWLWRTRYSQDGVHAFCPKEGAERAFKKYHTGQQRQSWTCTHCGHHLHPTAGTIYHKSSTSLHLWFYAIYLMTSTRCGISAKQLEREIGVTYKTAWRIFHLIRNELMEQDDDQLSGTVEVDEMFVGGIRKESMGRKPKPKIPVLGMVERSGRVKAVVIRDTTALTMYPHIRKQVRTGSEIFTDRFSAYNQLHRSGFVHSTIQHDLGIFVTGNNVHTQTIEGFWALVKRGIGGVYHAVSPKHLQSYLSEYVFRYNHRNEPRAMFLTLLLRAARP